MLCGIKSYDTGQSNVLYNDSDDKYDRRKYHGA